MRSFTDTELRRLQRRAHALNAFALARCRLFACRAKGVRHVLLNLQLGIGRSLVIGIRILAPAVTVAALDVTGQRDEALESAEHDWRCKQWRARLLWFEDGHVATQVVIPTEAHIIRQGAHHGGVEADRNEAAAASPAVGRRPAVLDGVSPAARALQSRVVRRDHARHRDGCIHNSTAFQVDAQVEWAGA